MIERRKVPRQRSYMGGVLAFNRRWSTMECLVRDISPEGARLIVGSTSILPDELDLTIKQRERSYRVRLAWRDAEQAGVSFRGQDVPPAPTPLDWARRLRTCEEEKKKLRKRVEQLTEPY